MARFPGILLTALMIGSTVMSVQAGAPPAQHTRRRRKPPPDPEKDALQQKLADATQAIGALDSRILQLMAENASLHQSLDAQAAAAAEARQKLDAATQSVASLQARLQAAEQHAAQLTAERDKALRSAAQTAQRAPSAQEARLEAQLQDINRRRDAYIASVLRRYRELANEYRSFGTEFGAPNDRDLASKAGPELTHIQNTVALAEEDLRQLNGLEAQAALVRKAQAKARMP